MSKGRDYIVQEAEWKNGLQASNFIELIVSP